MPVGIVGDFFEDHPGPWEAVAVPGILAHEDRAIGVVEVRRSVARHRTVQLAVDPELAGLLLGQRIGLVAHPESLASRPREPAWKMVALSAATVVEDLLPAMFITDFGQTGGHFANGRVPADLLEGSVGPAAQRSTQAIRAVLVVV